MTTTVWKMATFALRPPRVRGTAVVIAAIAIALLTALVYIQWTASPATADAPRADTMCFAARIGLSCR
jgi:hypothetical protein